MVDRSGVVADGALENSPAAVTAIKAIITTRAAKNSVNASQRATTPDKYYKVISSRDKKE